MTVQFSRDPLPIANHGERHVPAVLLVDTSDSMSGVPINELNQGLVEFGIALHEDSLALGRAEICIISFNSTVQLEMSFRPAANYEAPILSARGMTSLNEGIETALDIIESRKAEYRLHGVSYYRPWLFLLTDGAPTDNDKENAAKTRLQSAISQKKVVYLPMGIGSNADTDKLQSYYPVNSEKKVVLKANSQHFKDAFIWLSQSLSVISKSDPNVTEQVELPPTPNTITVGI